MAISVTQSKQSTLTGQVTSRAVTFDSAVTVGASIVLIVLSRYPITSVTDNKSNTYQKVGEKNGAGSCCSIWLSAAVATGGSSFIVTATAGSFPGPIATGAVEVNANLQALVAQTGTATNAFPTLNIGIAQESYVAIAFDAGPFSGTINASPSGYASRVKDTFTQLGEGMDRVYSSSAGLVTVTWTLGVARNWVACGTVFIAKLQANFTGTPTTGLAPYTVDFTDTSTGSPTTWSWSFGDGGTSTSQNPSHEYTAAGSYTVTLTVTNGGQISSFSRSGYIIVDAGGTPGDAPTAPGIPNNPLVTFGPPIPGAPWMTQAFLPPLLPVETPAEEEVPRRILLVPNLQDRDRLEREARLVALFLNALSRSKQLFRTGNDEFALRTCGFALQRDPDESDDVSTGARAGAIAVNQADETAFVCVDATLGAAVWIELDTDDPDGVSGGLTGTFP